MLEKFHVPFIARINVICGDFNLKTFRFTLREKISGRSKTPIRTSFAVINGAALNLGSSATLKSLAIRLPEKMRQAQVS